MVRNDGFICETKTLVFHLPEFKDFSYVLCMTLLWSLWSDNVAEIVSFIVKLIFISYLHFGFFLFIPWYNWFCNKATTPESVAIFSSMIDVGWGKCDRGKNNWQCRKSSVTNVDNKWRRTGGSRHRNKWKKSLIIRAKR